MAFCYPYTAPRAPPLWWPLKPAGATVTQSFDMSTVLTAGQINEIVSVSVQVAPSGSGEMIPSALSVTSGIAMVTETAGQPSRVYSVLFTVALSDGRTVQWVVYQGVPPGLRGYPVPVAPSPGYGAAVVWIAPISAIELEMNAGMIELENGSGIVLLEAA